MKVWAIADLHLAFGAPDKTMEVFGPQWKDYAARIKEGWEARITPEDLVLLAGDISWAKTLDQGRVDLAWIESLPGTKVMIRGNHDYWWGSLSKLRNALPPSIHVIQNDAFHFHGISIAGSRLWDTPEYDFHTEIDFGGIVEKEKEKLDDNEKIFKRELERLELSLKALKQDASIRIAMTHYPPIGADLKPSRASILLEKYHVTIVVFGHLHNVKPGLSLFGKKGEITYYLTSSDYLNFVPIEIHSSAK